MSTIQDRYEIGDATCGLIDKVLHVKTAVHGGNEVTTQPIGTWEAYGHTITVTQYGYFSVNGEGSWPTLQGAREEAEKRQKHAAAVTKTKLLLPAVDDAGNKTVITGLHRTTGLYTTNPSMTDREPKLYPETPGVNALIQKILAADDALRIMRKRLEQARVSPLFNGYNTLHISPEEYPALAAKAEAAYASALVIAKELQP